MFEILVDVEQLHVIAEALHGYWKDNFLNPDQPRTKQITAMELWYRVKQAVEGFNEDGETRTVTTYPSERA